MLQIASSQTISYNYYDDGYPEGEKEFFKEK